MMIVKRLMKDIKKINTKKRNITASVFLLIIRSLVTNWVANHKGQPIKISTLFLCTTQINIYFLIIKHFNLFTLFVIQDC